MKDMIEKRLAELKAEYDIGQRKLADMEKRRAELEATMLRISGAIQVLEEMLTSDSTETE